MSTKYLFISYETNLGPVHFAAAVVTDPSRNHYGTAWEAVEADAKARGLELIEETHRCEAISREEYERLTK